MGVGTSDEGSETVVDKEQTAIERLQYAAQMSEMLYKQPLLITVSGGKDSSVILELARRSGIPFEVCHSHTTADAPETVRFVRSEFKRMEELALSASSICQCIRANERLCGS